jgi:hypothetical protein
MLHRAFLDERLALSGQCLHHLVVQEAGLLPLATLPSHL